MSKPRKPKFFTNEEILKEKHRRATSAGMRRWYREIDPAKRKALADKKAAAMRDPVIRAKQRRNYLAVTQTSEFRRKQRWATQEYQSAKFVNEYLEAKKGDRHFMIDIIRFQCNIWQKKYVQRSRSCQEFSD